MKRHIVAGLSILAVASGTGLALASHSENSTGLQDISLSQNSEHSQASSTNATARIRVRLMPSEFGDQVSGTTQHVPQVNLTAQ
jgi:hypothetical protein